ncbi:hypothetical protein QCN27_03755 [Cereibacter sp. SYSU M97828]|nr:hypothetical protein [Cereibacter flavus]
MGILYMTTPEGGQSVISVRRSSATTVDLMFSRPGETTTGARLTLDIARAMAEELGKEASDA